MDNNPIGEFIINRPIEIKCNECGIVSVPKYQMEKIESNEFNNQGQFVYGDGSITLCDECMAKGWTSDPKEILEAFEKDPAFKLGVKSPYGHKKY